MAMEKNEKIARREGQKRSRLVAVFAIAGLLSVAAAVMVVNKNLKVSPSSSSVRQELQRGAPVAATAGKQLLRQKSPGRSSSADIQKLEQEFQAVEKEVRAIKATGVIMEKDEQSLEVSGRLQKAAKALCEARYGDQGPYRIKVVVEFQQPGLAESDRHATFVIETAPLDLIPYSVFNFLEVVRGYHSGGFHRKAGHVLQVSVQSALAKNALAFQEYSPQFPHKKKTVGYCGRPSGHGGCWYISTMDNTRNHGPGSQQKKNPYEADANFGLIIEGYDEVEPRIRSALPKDGFIGEKKNWVLIPSMTILVPDGKGGYAEWMEDAHDTVAAAM